MKLESALFCLALLAAPAFAAAQQKPETSTTTSAAVKKPTPKYLRAKRDEMREVTWYRHSTSPRNANVNSFFLYFGVMDSGTFGDLRLVARYFDDDWLFVHSAWAKADNERVVFPQVASGAFGGWKRDHDSGEIWEWSDKEVDTPEGRANVRKMAEAKVVTVRFEGRQYYNDRKLTAQQLKSMREVIAAYEQMTGEPWE